MADRKKEELVTRMTPAKGAVVWITCSLIAFGGFNATFEQENVYQWHQGCRRQRQDHSFAVFLALVGPISLVVAAVVTGLFQDGIALDFGCVTSYAAEQP